MDDKEDTIFENFKNSREGMWELHVKHILKNESFRKTYGYKKNRPPLIYNHNKEELSEWVNVEGCWTRTVKGGDPNNVIDRRCFIEKTPRIFDRNLGLGVTNCYSWVEGPKGYYGDEDGTSRKWCDEVSKYLGYILPKD